MHAFLFDSTLSTACTLPLLPPCVGMHRPGSISWYRWRQPRFADSRIMTFQPAPSQRLMTRSAAVTLIEGPRLRAETRGTGDSRQGLHLGGSGLEIPLSWELRHWLRIRELGLGDREILHVFSGLRDPAGRRLKILVEEGGFGLGRRREATALYPGISYCNDGAGYGGMGLRTGRANNLWVISLRSLFRQKKLIRVTISSILIRLSASASWARELRGGISGARAQRQ